jgi:serine/threonine-protein kinase
MVLNLTGTNDDGSTSTGAVGNATSAPAVAATTPAAAPTTAAPAPQVTYAGKVNGGGATIAIALKDGKAVAYLCDGRSTEAWLQGTAANGQLSLTGAGGASLTATYGNGLAAGTISARSREWAFSVGTVSKPSGLYRATANVRNAEVVGGWIVLANGEQVGVLVVGDDVEPAPELNTSTNTVNVDGTQITANPVDGTGL